MAESGVARVDKFFADDDAQKVALGDPEKEAVLPRLKIRAFSRRAATRARKHPDALSGSTGRQNVGTHCSHQGARP